MIAGENLDLANTKLAALRPKVKLCDVEQITKRTELGKPKVCSNPTYYKYIKGNGTDEVLAERIIRELSKVMKARGVDIDSLLNPLSNGND